MCRILDEEECFCCVNESLALVVLSLIPEWFGDGEIVLSDEGRHVVSTCSMSAFLSRL